MEYERCILCHRKLKSKEARARGLGSKCWSKLQKLDRQEKAKKKERMEAKKLKMPLLKGQINIFDKEGE